MLRIEHIAEEGRTRLRFSGELRSADLEEARKEIRKLASQTVLDLSEISLVDREGVRWLNACQTVGVKVECCTPYILEWMHQENL